MWGKFCVVLLGRYDVTSRKGNRACVMPSPSHLKGFENVVLINYTLFVFRFYYLFNIEI